MVGLVAWGGVPSERGVRLPGVLAGCGGSQGRLGPVWAAPGVLGASMLAWVALLGLVARVAASAACGPVRSHWGCVVLVAGVRLSH